MLVRIHKDDGEEIGLVLHRTARQLYVKSSEDSRGAVFKKQLTWYQSPKESG